MRVTPRANRDVLTAGTDEHFSARLAAPPVEGAANIALIALVARTFDVPKRAVKLIAGETARLKRLRVEGQAAALSARAAAISDT